jgi:cathepsin C
MMEDIYKNGPIVVSFEPDYNFMLYKKGIYHSLYNDSWIVKGLPKPEWEKVDHSVLLAGWGIKLYINKNY